MRGYKGSRGRTVGEVARRFVVFGDQHAGRKVGGFKRSILARHPLLTRVRRQNSRRQIGDTNMYLQSLLPLLPTLLCTPALARAFPHPEAFDEHGPYIRAPAVALRDHPVGKTLPVFYRGKSATDPPHQQGHHSLRIRANSKSSEADRTDKRIPSNTSGESYTRKSALRPRSPAEIYIPSSRRYTPATCVEPECEKICICYQKEPKLVPYPWIKPAVPCIELCRYEACSCSTPQASRMA